MFILKLILFDFKYVIRRVQINNWTVPSDSLLAQLDLVQAVRPNSIPNYLSLPSEIDTIRRIHFLLICLILNLYYEIRRKFENINRIESFECFVKIAIIHFPKKNNDNSIIILPFGMHNKFIKLN